MDWTTIQYQDYTIRGAGIGGAPHVIIEKAGRTVASFFAFESSVRNGVRIGIVGGQLKVGPGLGGAPLVKTYELATGQEIKAEFLGDQNDRWGSLGFGRIPIVCNPSWIMKAYEVIKPIESFVYLTTQIPGMYPSEFLMAVEMPLSWYGQVTGLTNLLWKNRQPSSMVFNAILVERQVHISYKPYVFAHEVGHFFGLQHREGRTGIMAAPAENGGSFTEQEIQTMIANASK